MSTRTKRVMTQPITQIYRLLQNKTRVQIALFEDTSMRLEGVIIGFDEYINLVLDEACEVDMKEKSRPSRKVGRVLLKGDNIAMILIAKVQ